ncbi:MAG: LCP family protein [Erysipelotrichaceae bacterium]|nr:LCP family protein [Erysipelotrichaceae bacterium]
MNKNKNILGIITLAFAALQTLVGGYLIFQVAKYTELSRSIIIGAIIAILALILLIDVIAFYSYKFRNKGFSIAGLVLGIGMLALTYVGSFYLGRVDKTIDDMSETEVVITETHTVALVTYQNDKLNSIDDLTDPLIKFGYIDNESFVAGNKLALEVIDNNKLNLAMEPYESYNDLLLALFEGNVDVAALPDNYYSMFSVNDGYEDYLDNTKTIYTYSKDMEVDNLGGNDKDLTQEPFTVLLMGMDEQRTDSLMVATFNPKRMAVTLTSIPRDSFVPIACYNGNRSDKINHARTISRQCTIDTVQNLMDITIDFYVEVNFYGVVQMVDAMDGLFLYSPVRFIGQQAGYENDENGRGKYWVDVVAGWAQRDGQQTLALARERHAMPNGDFDRIQHQQEIIQAMVSKMLEMRDVNKILKVIEAAGENVRTNFNINQITQLVNFGLKAMSTTYEGRTNGVSGLFKITNSRLTGYSSWDYNEAMQLPLWIYILYDGSIADNKAIIDRNLWTDTTLKNAFSADYDTFYPFYDDFTVKEYYNEAHHHPEMPDIMPTMKFIYTLEEVKSWIADRDWIKLKVVEVRQGDADYSADYKHNLVIAQSVSYGKITKDMTELTVWVIKHDVNCKLEENREYEDCGAAYVVPVFTGMSLTEVNDWKSAHPDIAVSVTTIDSSSASFNPEYANKVMSQSVEAYTLLKNVTGTIELVYCDASNVTVDFATLFNYSKSDMDAWIKQNWSNNYEYRYPYSDSVAAGKIISISIGGTSYSANSGSATFKTDNSLVVTISNGPEPTLTIPTFTTVDEYKAWCSANSIKENIVNEEKTDDSKAGTTEITQSMTGTYKGSEVAGGLYLTVTKYVAEVKVDIPAFTSVDEYNAFMANIGGSANVSYADTTIEDEAKAGTTETVSISQSLAAGNYKISEARGCTLTVTRNVYVAPAPVEPEPEQPTPEEPTPETPADPGTGGNG